MEQELPRLLIVQRANSLLLFEVWNVEHLIAGSELLVALPELFYALISVILCYSDAEYSSKPLTFDIFLGFSTDLSLVFGLFAKVAGGVRCYML